MTTISTPPTAPDRSSPSTFSDRADAFVAWLEATVPDFNSVRSETNTFKDDAEAAKTAAEAAEVGALAASSFKGAWSALSGSLSVPASVVHSGNVYILNSNLADVTASEPGVSGDWTQVSGVTLDANGNLNLTGEILITSYLEKTVALSGTSPSVDCATGNVFTLTTSGNTTFSFDFTNIDLTTDSAYGFTLKVTAGGAHTLTWPASVDWPKGSAPDAPASGETDVYVFFTDDGGTTWYGDIAMDALS